MNCKECNFYWYDELEETEMCHADHAWPAPCEEEEEEADRYTLDDLGNNWW